MRVFILFLLAASVALPAAAEPQAALDSEDDKVIYMMGVSFGQNFVPFGFDEREAEIVARGLRDSLFDRELAADIAEYGPKMNEFAGIWKARVAKIEREASKLFLAEAEAVEGALKTESGLIYSETKAGDGATPSATDKVKVHYRGTLRDGTVFASSRDRGEPATFPVNQGIPCWTEALQQMKVGGKAVIVCPSEIAYGDEGAGWIMPGAALRFEVELIAIE